MPNLKAKIYFKTHTPRGKFRLVNNNNILIFILILMMMMRTMIMSIIVIIIIMIMLITGERVLKRTLIVKL